MAQVAGPLGLADLEVSRTHATISWDADAQAASIEDRSSRNGTRVNGAKIAGRVPLPPGSIVRVGATLLTYTEHIVANDARLEPERHGLLGPSLDMQLLRGAIAQVAPGGIPVLVLGETGVGKERVAAALHAESGRTGRFIPVNCGALPEALAESELFGHVAGAFTGAQKRSEGLVASADGGTLFLDEIGEMPKSVQAKLLRTLAVGEVRPVGSSEASNVDVRFVAATLRSLSVAADEGSFRSDLLSRLAGWTLLVPPLRARKDDVLTLARTFLERAAPGMGLSADAAEALLLHAWPYNVRELEQAMNAAALRAKDAGVVGIAHLGENVAAAAGGDVLEPTDHVPLSLQVPRELVPDAASLTRVLVHFHGNVSRVAAYFSKDRRQIYRWAERHDLKLSDKE